MNVIGAQTIEVRGACEHNLKNIDVTIDRNAITVITGVSGSGKSSLAFDTVLAEAQRRFFYTLSHYSRQFLDLQSRPAVRFMAGLSPAISLAQNETQPSRRATVGTLSDVSELLGVMLARFGEQRCPTHDLPTAAQSPQEIANRLAETYPGEQIAICAPVVEAKKGVFKAQLTSYAQKGYLRAHIDGALVPLAPLPQLAKDEKHTIKLVIDYVKIKPQGQGRLLRSIEVALQEGGGFGEYYVADAKGELDLARGGAFSAKGGCPVCGYSWGKLDSRHFSSNSLGRCNECFGLGFDAGALSDDEDEEKAEDLNLRERTGLNEPCSACGGTGLDARLDGIRLGGRTPRALHGMPLVDLRAFLETLEATPLAQNLAYQRVAFEVKGALQRIIDVGLAYLTISRRIRSLSGGEGQRLKLAGILAENLRGVLYILDEPSQGLHPSEIETIWQALERLKTGGNTVIIVDHDELLMRKADYIIDLGPGGGSRGGKLMAKFKPSEAASFARVSSTAHHLAHPAPMAKAETARPVPSDRIVITGARMHNLAIDRVEIPVGGFTVVAGVSGAGKSSLVLSTLYPNVATVVANARRGAVKSKAPFPRHCKTLTGADGLESVALIDRRPIAKSSVSIPATYLDIFGELRDLYASLPDAQVLGLTARQFSLHAEGGRCPECKGKGELSMKMRFLADARVRCPVCKGCRYRPNVLQVKYAGLSMSDVLELTLDEAMEHFKTHKKIVQRLQPAVDLGLGYLKLGQPSASLSGGEAQRLKLVPYLTKRHGKGSLIVLDEPTTGLHFEDVARLMRILRNLVERETTIVAIEHSKDVIAAADWIVEVGPGAAAAGGKLLYQGPPAGLKASKTSVIARHLV